jgi:hypothetical protein
MAECLAVADESISDRTRGANGTGPGAGRKTPRNHEGLRGAYGQSWVQTTIRLGSFASIM